MAENSLTQIQYSYISPVCLRAVCLLAQRMVEGRSEPVSVNAGVSDGLELFVLYIKKK